jgi:hypothetical protein
MYYALMIQWDKGGDWSPEFGDYDLDSVIYERFNYMDTYDIYKRQTVILKCRDDSMEALSEARAKANI